LIRIRKLLIRDSSTPTRCCVDLLIDALAFRAPHVPTGRGEKALVKFTKGRAVERNSWIRLRYIQITEPSKVENRQAARFQPAVSSGYSVERAGCT